MKSLNDIKLDMSILYDSLKSGHTDIKLASELANISGKFMKAEQLILAREIFEGRFSSINNLHCVQKEVQMEIVNA